MKVFITGGSGFIGGHVLRKLVARGDEVLALARSDRSAARVEARGASAVRGDLLDREALRAGMRGCDLAFHIAAWYELGANDPAKMEAINVQGTRNVLETAVEVGVPRIVYTSSLAVFGDTHGEVVDEGFFQGGPFLNDYDRTKWLAHYEVALPLIEKGAPIVIVQPGAVYGPGDHSLVGTLMEMFVKGQLPALPGPETRLTYAHVEDIAEGHVLAADAGRVGESYILAGPALSLRELFALWEELSGRRGPLFEIPAARLRPLAPMIGALEAYVPVPSAFSRDSLAILGATYTASADKARDELGWMPRSIRAGMQETLDHALWETVDARLAQRRRLALAGLALGTGLLLAWTLSRRKRRG